MRFPGSWLPLTSHNPQGGLNTPISHTQLAEGRASICPKAARHSSTDCDPSPPTLRTGRLAEEKPVPPHRLSHPMPGCLGDCCPSLLLGILLSTGTTWGHRSRWFWPGRDGPGLDRTQERFQARVVPTPGTGGGLVLPSPCPHSHPMPRFPHLNSGALRGRIPPAWQPPETCHWLLPRGRWLRARFPTSLPRLRMLHY